MIEPGTTDPLTTGWTFSNLQGGVFSDNGTVSGKRQLAFASPASANDACKIEKTITGLVNGTTSFSVTFLQTGTECNIVASLFADDVLLAGPTQLTSGAASTLTGSATVSGTQCKITLKLLQGDNIGGGISNTQDIYSLTLSVAAVTLTMAQGSYTLTGQNLLFVLIRNYTLALAYGTYALTGQVLSFIQPMWMRDSKNTSSFSNGAKNTSAWSNVSKNSSSFSNDTKH